MIGGWTSEIELASGSNVAANGTDAVAAFGAAAGLSCSTVASDGSRADRACSSAERPAESQSARSFALRL